MVVANVPVPPGVMQPSALQPIVAIVLVAYLIYAIWSAYSTGVNHSLIKKQKLKGIVSYGPYLGLVVSFIGVALVLFIVYELFGYYTGFIRLNVPSDIASLDFFTFLYRQFFSIDIRYGRFIIFLVIGLVLSASLSYLTVRFLYRKGLAKTSK